MKKFIVMSFIPYEGWSIDLETDDFQEAVSAYKLAKFVEEDAMIVSPVKYTVLAVGHSSMVLENIDQNKPSVSSQYEMFEEV